MCFSSAGYSSWRVAFTIATSSSARELLLPTLARPMLVWSFTAPRALLILLGAMRFRRQIRQPGVIILLGSKLKQEKELPIERTKKKNREERRIDQPLDSNKSFCKTYRKANSVNFLKLYRPYCYYYYYRLVEL